MAKWSARGRYLAVTACGECHGANLDGAAVNGQTTPNLIVASAYDREGFGKFLRTGVSPDGAQHGWMSEIAREHFSVITEKDLDDIHAYLMARAERR